jgi:small subunit ribosomal protein S8
MTIDLISNMLSSLKNASMAGKKSVEVMHTNQVEAIAKNLKEAGFLEEVKTFKESGKSFKKLRLDLAYENGLPKITDVQIVSKPGRRVYKGYKDMKLVAGGFGVSVVSTSRGILSGSEARKKKLGGEVICNVK